MTEPAAENERLDSPMMASIRRVLQQIEDSKPNLICSPDDEDRIKQALESRGMTNMVKVHTSTMCEPGEAYVAKPINQLITVPQFRFGVLDVD